MFVSPLLILEQHYCYHYCREPRERTRRKIIQKYLIFFKVFKNCSIHQRVSPLGPFSPKGLTSTPHPPSATCYCFIISNLVLLHHQPAHAPLSSTCSYCIIINLLLLYHHQPAPASSATCSCCIISNLLNFRL